MKFTTTFSLAALFASLVASADVPQSEIDFFTALVGDYQDHKTDYIKYFATAKDIPAELSTIATKVLTYQDDSYTTLLENDSLDVKAIESYVTELPWYTRLQEAVAGAAS
ncbi:Repressed By RIM101 protein 2, partial [Candida tropicalis]